MNNLITLQQRKAGVEARIKPIIDENQAMLDRASAEKRDLTVEEASAFDANTEKIKPLKAELQRHTNHIAEVADSLARETAGGRRPGAVADDDGTPRFKSFGEQLVAVHRAALTGRPDPRLLHGYFDQKTGEFKASGGSDGAMNEAVPSQGGFLVGADVSEEVFQRTYQTGEIVRRCQKMPISATSDRLKLRVVDEDSRQDGSRMGGVLAFWQNEADTFLSSRPKFREVELNLNKLTALVFSTDELLADAPALEAWIMNNLPTELQFRVEDAIINGTGAGQPAGILNSQATIQAAGQGGGSGSFPSAADLTYMWSRFWHPQLQNSIASIQEGKGLTVGNGGMPGACWLVDQSMLTGLFPLTIGTGIAAVLLYHPPGYNGLPGPYGQLLGLPVIPTEHNTSVGNVGDIILADFSQYLIADKGGPQAAYSMHVRFLQGEGTFRFTLRIDGQTPWKKPLTPKSGGPTLSPFLTLATGGR